MNNNSNNNSKNNFEFIFGESSDDVDSFIRLLLIHLFFDEIGSSVFILIDESNDIVLLVIIIQT